MHCTAQSVLSVNRGTVYPWQVFCKRCFLLHFSLWTAAKFGISREMCRTVQKAPSATRGTFPPALTAAEKKKIPLVGGSANMFLHHLKLPWKKMQNLADYTGEFNLKKNMYSAHLLCILSPVQYCIFMTPPPSSQLSFSSFYDLTSQLSAPQATSSPLLKFSPCPDSTGLLSPAAPDAQQILLPSSCHQPSSPSPSSPLQLNCQLPQSFTTFFLLHLTQQPLQVLQPSLLTVQQSSSHSFINNILCVLMCHSSLFLFQKRMPCSKFSLKIMQIYKFKIFWHSPYNFSSNFSNFKFKHFNLKPTGADLKFFMLIN